MRLIDADVLTGFVTELYEYDLYHDDADYYSEGRASAEHGILETLLELPTIDAIPVEWLIDRANDPERAPLYRRYAQMLYEEWQKEQEA